jgi:L-lactate dehydrogenase complex protein LldF
VQTTDTGFDIRIRDALADERVRGNFRRAMDGLMQRRLDLFPDPAAMESLRQHGMRIKAQALSRLPELLEQLEERLSKNGIIVHWAETTEEANRIVLAIMHSHDATSLIKGKSMVSEEMGLNDFLIGNGIDVLESDLGEFILQLAGEPPSHIVAPAIHKDRYQIAELFREKFPDIPYTEDINELTQNARTILRDRFEAAEVGLSGVNFAVAETGTLCLVENEGNGRMSTTVPPVHIAVTGIEKVVETFAEIPPLLTLLTRSATGQPITTYFNMISSPRKPGEKDGPKEVHLVLLDNGRSDIYGDPELLATLRCIRCGACMNHCPVYTRIGGHAYGTVYPGPIGTILEPQKGGLDNYGGLTTASSLCGACGEVCPVRIPIPQLINRLRYEASHGEGVTRGSGSKRKAAEALAWKGWSLLHRKPVLYRLMATAATRLRGLMPSRLGAWTRYRSAPRPAASSLHELARRHGVDHE